MSRGWWRHLLVVLGCVHLLGGPAALVQGIAWASMLVNYSAQDGLAQGVKDTFSGEKPCALCLKAAAMEKQQSDSPAAPEKQDRRLLGRLLSETLSRSEIAELSPPATRWLAWQRRLADSLPPLRSLGERPELPPPRAGC
ncbi:hypothetical protein [Haloferula sargassicola]